MIAANPDHFLIATAPDGRQEVIGTTGGSPLPARFFIDYDDDTALTSGLAPEYERDASGVAQDERGTAIGGVRHQFRDTDGGFHAHLVVEFASTMLPSMLDDAPIHDQPAPLAPRRRVRQLDRVRVPDGMRPLAPDDAPAPSNGRGLTCPLVSYRSPCRRTACGPPHVDTN